MMGSFWSIPPFTLNPNLPCSSGIIVMNTKPPSPDWSTVKGLLVPISTSMIPKLLFTKTCSSAFMDKFWGGWIRDPTVLAPAVINVGAFVCAKFSVWGMLHLFPFVKGMFEVVKISGGGFGERPPIPAHIFGLGWICWIAEGCAFEGNDTPDEEVTPDGGECFLFPALPTDSEVNPDASELVPIALPRSDNDESSVM